jgi:hypothetical protein
MPHQTENISFQEIWECPDDAWLPPNHAAVMLDLSKSRLAQLRSDGAGPPYSKRGRLIRYNVRNIKKWLAGS